MCLPLDTSPSKPSDRTITCQSVHCRAQDYHNLNHWFITSGSWPQKGHKINLKAWDDKQDRNKEYNTFLVYKIKRLCIYQAKKQRVQTSFRRKTSKKGASFCGWIVQVINIVCNLWPANRSSHCLIIKGLKGWESMMESFEKILVRRKTSLVSADFQIHAEKPSGQLIHALQMWWSQYRMPQRWL